MSKQYPVRKSRILAAFFVVSFILSLCLTHVSIATNQLGFGTVAKAQDRNASQLVEKGIKYYDEGKYREAVQEWETALNIYQKNKQFPEQAIVSGNLANAFEKLGDLEQNIKYWNAAVNLYQQTENSREKGRALAELGQAYSNSGQYKKAIEILCGEEESEIEEDKINIYKIKRKSNCLPSSALEISRAQNDIKGEVAGLGSIAEAYRLLAKYNLANKYLNYAEKIGVDDLSLQKISNSLGNVYLGKAQLWTFYADSAKESGLPKFNNIAVKADSYYQNAQKNFQKSYGIAVTQNNKSAQMKALINLIQVNSRIQKLKLSPDENYQTSERANAENKTQALSLLDRLPDSPQKAYAAIELANLSADDSVTSPFTQCPKKRQLPDEEVVGLLNKAIKISNNIKNSRAQSFALGAAGHFYECENNYSQALELTRKAILAADYKLQANDSLYLWEWQQARLLEKRGKESDAIAAYEAAFQTLEKIRADIITADRDLQLDFRDVIQPLYRKLASLKLEKANPKVSLNQKASKQADKNQQVQELDTARNIIDSLRLAELQNYFGNDCISALITPQKVDELVGGEEGKTAVFSSIILENKAAILLSLPDNSQHIEWIKQTNNQIITREKLESEIRTFLEELIKQHTFRAEDSDEAKKVYAQAENFYEWIIRPFEEKGYLNQDLIDTLVFVQDGLFRSIPMSALIDKNQDRYLIEKYAIATTPSLNLTAPKAAKGKTNRAMLFGFSEKATIDEKEYPALEYVNKEIKALQELFSSYKVLNYQDFSLADSNEKPQKTDYPIIHIATHAQFGIIPEDTFLVLGDNNPLTISDLEKSLRKFSSNPNEIDLLTLSACQTAAGDDRATLGLAGIALQSGVRSALASLWSVNDQSTSILVKEFYQNLRQGKSKAQALQQAQIALIRNPNKISDIQEEYKKPYYWSPFIMIGNWL
ncbi:DUF2225 domain-containing protein [Calothrix sp. CCY 0018]|uniref:DUF2225 domain-containing protein n=1 Tax=Calothrix sp. CCY 0018 TaxID=3103864 RepID=UPI0039C67497